MKRQKGSIGDFMSTGLCLLGMTAVMLVYLGCARLIQTKTEISQIARKYILRMETAGMLTDEDRSALFGELEAAGATRVQLEGTTLWQVNYGDPIILQIQGKIEDRYDFTEKRVSTAKH